MRGRRIHDSGGVTMTGRKIPEPSWDSRLKANVGRGAEGDSGRPRVSEPELGIPRRRLPI